MLSHAVGNEHERKCSRHRHACILCLIISIKIERTSVNARVHTLTRAATLPSPPPPVRSTRLRQRDALSSKGLLCRGVQLLHGLGRERGAATLRRAALRVDAPEVAHDALVVLNPTGGES